MQNDIGACDGENDHQEGGRKQYGVGEQGLNNLRQLAQPTSCASRHDRL